MLTEVELRLPFTVGSIRYGVFFRNLKPEVLIRINFTAISFECQ